MIKKVILTAVLLCTAVFIYASQSLSVFADTATVQDLVKKWSNGSAQVTVGADLAVIGNFHVRVPVSFTFNKSASMLEAGLCALYYPFTDGPFMSLSLVQVGFVMGNSTIDKSVISLNEICIGWTFKIARKIIIEPSVCVRDVSGAFKEEYSQIRGEFPCYKTVRGRLCIGLRIGGD